MPDFLPRREVDLLNWSRNFSQGISLDPQSLGLTLEQAESYALAHAGFDDLYRKAVEPDTRTQPVIVAKNDSLTSLKAQARILVRLVRATPSVTDTQLVQLGLKPAEGSAPLTHAPGEPPFIKVQAVEGKRVFLRLREGGASTRRGKPRHTIGAMIAAYVGEEAPVHVDQWSHRFHTTVTNTHIDFPEDLAPGTVVWITACWVSPRIQNGPAAPPVKTWLSGGTMRMPDRLHKAA